VLADRDKLLIDLRRCFAPRRLPALGSGEDEDRLTNERRVDIHSFLPEPPSASVQADGRSQNTRRWAI